MMNNNFSQAIENRRSYYAIGKEEVVSTEQIQAIVRHAVKYVPSSFNSQSARVLVLFGTHHDKLWNIVREELRKIVPEDKFDSTDQKINSFQSGYGSVLYFEDQSVVEGLQEQFALYKDNFPVWSLQSSGMLQYVIWTLLEEAGLGASLQHYNPLIDEEVKKHWGVPKNWKLLAQMPFGKPMAPPDEKEFSPLEDRVKIFA